LEIQVKGLAYSLSFSTINPSVEMICEKEMDPKHLLANMSEEAKVSLLVLLVQGAANYSGHSSAILQMLLFAVFGGYLTLRLLRVWGLPKE
jgi:hypothetical protein